MTVDVSRMLFPIMRSALDGVMLSENEKSPFSKEALPELIALARRHDVGHLLAIALIDNGIVSNESRGACDELTKAVCRYELIRHELSALSAVLEDAKIAHVALKGSTMRKYYPKPYMRTSSDIDILVQQCDVERAIDVLGGCSYELIGRGLHDVSFRTPSKQLIELHFDLLEEGRLDNSSDIIKVLRSAWEYAVRVDGYEYRYELSDEFFYFYHIAHMAKHFQDGGCGIKPIIDLWMIHNRTPYNEEASNALLEKGGLLPFANEMRKLSRIWLDGEDYDDFSRELEKYIIDGGVYGTLENKVAVHQIKKGSKIRYALSKIFLKYEQLRFHYPVLNKHKWLFPFCQVRRWFKLLFRGGVRRSIHELELNKNVSSERSAKTAEMLTKLEL